MIVQCSACQTRFKIADDKVTERGVKVRCTKCANTFVVKKEAAEPPREEATRVAQIPVPPAARSEDPFAGRGAPEPSRLAPPVPGGDPFAGADSAPGLLGISPSPGGDPFSKNSLFGTLDNSGEEESAYSEPTRVGVSLAAIEASRKSAPAAAKPSLAPPAMRMPTPPRPAPAAAPASGDPFADLQLDLGGPPPPATAPVNQAKLDLGGDPFRLDAPAPPAPKAPPAASPPAGGLSFGDDLDLNLGGPTPEVAATMPAFKLGELDALAAPAPQRAADPFALGGELDLGAPAPRPAAPAARQPNPPSKKPAPAPAPAPAPKAAAPAIPDFGGTFELGSTAPAPSGGESPEFDSESPSGLDLDVAAPPKSAPQARAAAPQREKSNPSTPRPQPTVPAQPRAAPATVKAPEPVAPPPAPVAAPVSHPAIPVPRAPAAPKSVPVQKKSTLAALLNAFLFAMIGLAVLAIVVWLQSGGELELKDLNAKTLAAMFTGKAQGDLVARNATNGLYETQSGHPVFFVRGEVVNQAAATAGAVQVEVELRNGSEVVRRSSGWAGPVPSPEELFDVSDAVALSQLQATMARKAQALEAGKAAPFVVVFYDYPDDLADMRLRISAHVAERVAGAAKPGPEQQAEPVKAASAEGATAEAGTAAAAK